MTCAVNCRSDHKQLFAGSMTKPLFGEALRCVMAEKKLKIVDASQPANKL